MKYKEIRTTVSGVYSNFARSGNQDAENAYDEYRTTLSMMRLGQDTIWYAMATWPQEILANLGKKLISHVGEDHGIESAHDDDESVSDVADRLHRKEVSLSQSEAAIRKREYRRMQKRKRTEEQPPKPGLML